MTWAVFFFHVLTSVAQAYDCANSKPFVPVGFQNVRMNVGHFYWTTTETGSREEVVEDVCSTKNPVSIPILDIRNREEEWFYCFDGEMPSLKCTSTFRGRPAAIEVKPAIVIRNWRKGAALDHHFHAFILPDNDASKYFDLFARTLSDDLSPKAVSIDAAGGGRGENSGVDSFYVKAEFEN